MFKTKLKKIHLFFSNLFKNIRIIFFNEQTLVEEYSLKLSPSKFVLYLSCLVAIFIGLYFLFSFLISTIFSPNSNFSTVTEYKRETMKLKNKVDNLEDKIQHNNEYINRLRNIIKGDENIKLDTVKYKFSPSDTIQDIPVLTEIHTNTKATKQESKMVNEQNAKLKTPVSDLICPLKGSITNTLNFKKRHYAIDIASKTGNPIKSIYKGTVVLAEWTNSTGFVMIIQHSNSMISVYKHNSKLNKKVGDVVKAGDIIAFVGNTGEFTTGPHLHFEIWQKGIPLDPQKVINFER